MLSIIISLDSHYVEIQLVLPNKSRPNLTWRHVITNWWSVESRIITLNLSCHVSWWPYKVECMSWLVEIDIRSQTHIKLGGLIEILICVLKACSGTTTVDDIQRIQLALDLLRKKLQWSAFTYSQNILIMNVIISWCAKQNVVTSQNTNILTSRPILAWIQVSNKPDTCYQHIITYVYPSMLLS